MERLSVKLFIEQLRDAMAYGDASTLKQAFVFVHGYNVSFEDAAFRTAQIVHDMEFDGAPIFYSWPFTLSPTAWATTHCSKRCAI